MRDSLKLKTSKMEQHSDDYKNLTKLIVDLESRAKKIKKKYSEHTLTDIEFKAVNAYYINLKKTISLLRKSKVFLQPISKHTKKIEKLL